MTFTQGVLIAFLISLLIGIVIGYLLQRNRMNRLTEELRRSQQYREELEREHERRLQEATQQLQVDYERQLAEKIERYQDQLEEQTTLIKQEYQSRFSVLDQGRQQGLTALGAAPIGIGSAIGVGPAIGAGPTESVQVIEQQIKRQYEDRLKEAARKIQQAYEQHLHQKLQAARDLMQQEYEESLAQKIEHYESQIATRLEQIRSEYEFRYQVLMPQPMAQTGSGLATPSEPLSLGDATTLLSPEEAPGTRLPSPALGADPTIISEAILADIETNLRQEYEQKLAEKIEHYQDDLAQRIQDLEEEFEIRLQTNQQGQIQAINEVTPAVSEVDVDVVRASLRDEYDQELAEKIEHYQDEMSRRIQDLEEEYEARLQVAQQIQPIESSTMPSGIADISLDKEAIENSLRNEYEQQLAEKIEHYQDEMSRRIQDLEEEYEARLQVAQQIQTPNQPALDPRLANERLAEAGWPEEGGLEVRLSEPGESDLLSSLPDNLAAILEEAMPFVDTEPALQEVALPVEELAEGAITSETIPPQASLEGMLNLDEVLLSETTLEPGQPFLGPEFDEAEFNLDDLLFDQTDDNASEDDSFNLDDISRLS